MAVRASVDDGRRAMERSPVEDGELFIRPAVRRDAAEIAEVHVACWRETYAHLIPENVLRSLDVDARYWQWRGTLRNKAYDTFVCENGSTGRLCGFAGAGPRRAVPDAFDAEFLAIYLLQSAQGKGRGRALMQAMAEALSSRGCRSAALRVARDSSTARAFYEHLGGTDIGVQHQRVDDFRIVTLVYGWPDLSVLLPHKTE